MKSGKFKNDMKLVFLWLAFYKCVDCGKWIWPFHYCYDQQPRPRWMGPFHNHLHCVDCHNQSEKENAGDCQTCKNKI